MAKVITFGRRLATFAALAAWMGMSSLLAEDGSAALDRWLAAQAELKSWSADFTQTRHLKTLTQPLTTPGRVWFVAPNQFRWELGVPAQSVALRSGADLWMLSPRLKRAERHSLTAAQPGPMKDAVALIDSSFPRDPADFRQRFELVSFVATNALHEFRLRPRDSGARRLMPELALWVSSDGAELSATEVIFADGSRLRNDFINTARNPAIAAETFALLLGADWKVTAPAGR